MNWGSAEWTKLERNSCKINRDGVFYRLKDPTFFSLCYSACWLCEVAILVNINQSKRDNNDLWWSYAFVWGTLTTTAMWLSMYSGDNVHHVTAGMYQINLTPHGNFTNSNSKGFYRIFLTHIGGTWLMYVCIWRLSARCIRGTALGLIYSRLPLQFLSGFPTPRHVCMCYLDSFDVAFFGGYLLFPWRYHLDKDVEFGPSLSATGSHNPESE